MKVFCLNPVIRKRAAILFAVSLVITVSAEFLAYLVMTDFGNVKVSNVYIENKNGLKIRGKLFVPIEASRENRTPGIVYLHGYQNNRETSDPYAIELSRRGFTVLNIDTLGRGNSENQHSEDEPGFDPTFGGDSAFEYLRNLPFVDGERCGMGGHSLGGEMSYTAALENPNVKAIVFSGFAYKTESVTFSTPPNMLMIFGKYDEYRRRMTGTSNFEEEWMSSGETKAAIDSPAPDFNTTYGLFSDGTARRVHMTGTTHVAESFDRGALSEAASWFTEALNPHGTVKLSPENQTWRYKEILSLIALLTGFFSILPLSVLLLATPFFKELNGVPSSRWICHGRDFRKNAVINGLLMFLYIPSIMFFFAIHVYVFPLDTIFPMMMINGIVLWFLIINLIGFLLFRKWFKKQQSGDPDSGSRPVNLLELGVSESPVHFRLSFSFIIKTLLLGIIVFVYIYALEAGLESFLLIDYRFKFPYASDFTPYRVLMFLEYLLPFFLGYLYFNLFLQGRIRGPEYSTFMKTTAIRSMKGVAVIILPLIIHMAIQYIPLFLTGFLPFVGPGGVLVAFMINLEHMCVLLALMIPISTFLYHCTGKIYAGALVNALLVAWMFTSSSVIAPVPI